MVLINLISFYNCEWCNENLSNFVDVLFRCWWRKYIPHNSLSTGGEIIEDEKKKKTVAFCAFILNLSVCFSFATILSIYIFFRESIIVVLLITLSLIFVITTMFFSLFHKYKYINLTICLIRRNSHFLILFRCLNFAIIGFVENLSLYILNT
jgi:hypothetical protein